jgi:hypothetical protein
MLRPPHNTRPSTPRPGSAPLRQQHILNKKNNNKKKDYSFHILPLDNFLNQIAYKVNKNICSLVFWLEQTIAYPAHLNCFEE